jgi:hypothetical protein
MINLIAWILERYFREDSMCIFFWCSSVVGGIFAVFLKVVPGCRGLPVGCLMSVGRQSHLTIKKCVDGYGGDSYIRNLYFGIT